MKTIDRMLLATLAAGLWLIIGLQLMQQQNAVAQEVDAQVEAQEQTDARVPPTQLNASEIVGLDARIERVLRDRQLTPRSISGLDQHIRSVVRRCRVNGGTRGNRISNASISC